MLRNYFVIAWRILVRNRLYSLINVCSLSLGICGCIIIWLVAGYEFSFDRFHPDGDRIYRVVHGGNKAGEKDPATIPPLPEEMRQSIPGLEAITAYFPYNESRDVKVPEGGKANGESRDVIVPQTGEGRDVKVPEKGRQVKVFRPRLAGYDWQTGFIIADQDWFRVFPYQWLAGNPAVALKEPFRVVLTEGAARKYFGDLTPGAVIGRELIYEDSLHVYVSGVVRDWKGHSDMAYTDILSFPTIDASFLKERRHMDDWIPHQGMGRWYWPFAYVKLAKGVTTARVETQMDQIAAQHIPRSPGHPWFQVLQPLSDVHFNTDYDDNYRKAHLPTIYALAAIAIFILILAVVNFVNLATAQSLQRTKEIGVRKVLGSGRRALVIQFLIETGMLTAGAVAVAAALVTPAMRLFHEYIPAGVAFRPFAAGTALFLAGIVAVVTVLAGLYPARVLAGYAPVQTLKGSGSVKGGEKWWLRRSLIVFQFTISLVFMIVTLVIGHQIRYMLNTDYGFRSDAIVTVAGQGNMLDTTTSDLRLLRQRYSQLPGIAAVIPESNPPLGWGNSSWSFQYKGSQLVKFDAGLDAGDDGFIPFYGMRMLAGRNIRHTDSLSEFVINETLERQLGFRQPSEALGHLLYLGKKAVPIVGVVADFHQESLQAAIQPMVIGHNPNWERDLGIRLSSAGQGFDNVKTTLDAMEKIYKEVYPGQTFPYVFLDDSIRGLYNTEQATASMVRMAMGLALLISCMGLFGLSLFTAERRASEIGIRKVLGATTGDIALMLNRQFIRLVLLALVIASPAAWWLSNRWLQDFAYRAPICWWIFPLAGAGAIVVAVLTVSFQSIRAAAANPITNLRTE